MGARIKRLTITEAEVQGQIIEGLTYLGYLVLTVSRRYKRCRQCGTVSHHGDGVSRGTPDLLVRAHHWPLFLWLGMEVKRPGGQVRPEQRALRDRGAIRVVCSWEEALRAVQEIGGKV